MNAIPPANPDVLPSALGETLVVETDLGRDLDDFVAICYLLECGVKLSALLLSPGDPDQVALARYLASECQADFSIGVGSPKPGRRSTTPRHLDFLRQAGYPLRSEPDGHGSDLLARCLREGPCDLFICGPVDSTGQMLRQWPEGLRGSRVVIQGGYVGEDSLPPSALRAPDLAGRVCAPSFNLDGNREGTRRLLGAPVLSLAFIPKNIGHTTAFDADLNRQLQAHLPRTRAGQLLREMAGNGLVRHTAKFLHDPVAAVLARHPGLATWRMGKMVRRASGWTFQSRDPVAWSALDLDRSAVWQHLIEGV